MDPESYTEDCLRQDMAAAALIIQVIKQLAAKVAVVPTPRKSAAGSAIADIKKCYLSAVMKPKQQLPMKLMLLSLILSLALMLLAVLSLFSWQMFWRVRRPMPSTATY